MNKISMVKVILFICMALGLGFFLMWETGLMEKTVDVARSLGSGVEPGALAAGQDPQKANGTAAAPARKVVVYYFHGRYRCSGCMTIEAWTKEAIDRSFPQVLKSGRLEWRPVNAEASENKHFVQDYQLYTRSVIVSEVQGGKELRWKNLNRIWEYLGNRQKYFDYIKAEVQAYLG